MIEGKSISFFKKNAFESISGLVDYAEISMLQRDFKEALRRWAVVREKYPSYDAAYSRAAVACMELGDFIQAEELCIQGNRSRGLEKVYICR